MGFGHLAVYDYVFRLDIHLVVPALCITQAGLGCCTSQPGAFLSLSVFSMSAKRWRRTRITSPVEYIETRFNRPTHLFFSVYLSLAMLYWPAHHLASLSKICAPTLFPGSMVAIDVMIVVVGIIIMLYTFLGGLWAVCITERAVPDFDRRLRRTHSGHSSVGDFSSTGALLRRSRL